MVVGLTGRYCAGKNAAADVFAEGGFDVIDADEVSHEVLIAKRDEVIAAFGPGVGAKEGGVDRRALGRIVFNDPAARSRLEGILYPVITERIKRFIVKSDRDVLINAPLLHRAGLQALCRAVVFIRTPSFVRLARAMRRDKLRMSDAWARINAQKDVRPQSIGPGVDTYSVPNLGSVRALRRRVRRLIARMRG
jgi:dephospho-CoA kinase